MPWIGVDLDGTLARNDEKDFGATKIGSPVPEMVTRVKNWLLEGKEVRIFTARAAPEFRNWRHLIATKMAIDAWCLEHIGTTLAITNAKDPDCVEFWDDRAVQVIPNTGKRADGKTDS